MIYVVASQLIVFLLVQKHRRQKKKRKNTFTNAHFILHVIKIYALRLFQNDVGITNKFTKFIFKKKKKTRLNCVHFEKETTTTVSEHAKHVRYFVK